MEGNKWKNGSDAENVVSFSQFQKRRDEKILANRANINNESKVASGTNALPHEEIIPELEKLIMVKEGLAIARGIVEKYGTGDALLNAYLTEKRQDSSLENVAGFTAEFMLKKEMLMKRSTDDLKASLESYSKNPEGTFKTYIFCAAEEFIKRFPKEE